MARLVKLSFHLPFNTVYKQVRTKLDERVVTRLIFSLYNLEN